MSRPAKDVYVLTGAADRHKIGISRSPALRAHDLSRGWTAPYAVAFSIERPNGDARSVERLAHKMLKAHALGGEVFSVSVDVAIDAVKRAAASIDSGEVAPDWKSRDGKRAVAFWIDDAAYEALQIAAIRKRMTLQSVGEAMLADWKSKYAAILPLSDSPS